MCSLPQILDAQHAAMKKYIHWKTLKDCHQTEITQVNSSLKLFLVHMSEEQSECTGCSSTPLSFWLKTTIFCSKLLDLYRIFTSSQASDQWWQCTFQGFSCACCGTASSSMTSMASSIIMYTRNTSVQPLSNTLSALIESVTSGNEGLVLNMRIWFWFLLFQILCFS